MRRTSVSALFRMTMAGKGRALLALGLVAVAGLSGMLAGCGAGSEFLPSNLPGTGGGGVFLITTTTLEDGVINRSYSKAIDTVGGTPPVTNCSLAAGALPAGLGFAPMGAQCILSGTPTASGTFNFTLRADDSGTPTRTDTQDFTLVIRQEYSITTPAPDPLPDGVEDRAYNQVFTVMTNTVSSSNDVGQAGEFGNGPLTNCMVTGLPAGMTSNVSNLTANSCTVTLGGTPNIGLVAGSMPVAFSLTLAVTDTSISGSNVPARTITQTAIDLTIRPPMAFTLVTANAASTTCAGGSFNDAASGGAAPDAVNGRVYGNPRCDLLFQVSGGITPYTWTNTSVSPPAPFACTQETIVNPNDGFRCNSAGMAITTPGGTATSLTVQVQDTANAAVAQGTQTSDVNGHAAHGIFVNNAIAVVSDLGSPLPTAVRQRMYGDAPDTPATFTASGGLGLTTGYVMFGPGGGLNNGDPVFPATISCGQIAPNGPVLTCRTNGNTITAAVGTYFPLAIAFDTANDTTPNGNSNVPVTIDVVELPVFTFMTADAGTANPCTGGTFDDTMPATIDAIRGVIVRPYGGPARCDLLFQVTGGRAPFTWSVNQAAPAPIGCTQETIVNTNDAFRCNSGGANVTGSTAALGVQVTDTGNVSVSPVTRLIDDQGHGNHTIGIQNQLASIVTPQGVTPLDAPDGVTGRPLGTPTGGQDLVFSVPSVSGLRPVQMDPDENTSPGSSSAAGFPADLVCNQSIDAQTECTTGGNTITDPAGPYALTVSATDTQSDTTPSATTMDLYILQVNDEIVIDNLFLPNGVVGQPYNVDLTCNDGNPLCGGTGNPGNAAALYTWSEVAGPANPDVLVSTVDPNNPSTGRYSGTPTSAMSFSPIITVTDNGNSTTPSCNTAGTCPTFNTPYTILAALALVDASNNEIDTFTTDTGLPVFAGNITLDAGSQPFRIAVSPNATFAVDVDSAESEADIINLVSGAITTVPVSALPQSVAIGPATNPLANPDSYLAYVASFAGNSVDVIDIDPNSGSFGTVIASVAITNPRDLAITPTIDPGTGPETRAYVLSGADDVCAIDAEPTSGSFLTQIDIFVGVGNCIDTSFSSGDTTFIEISSDGITAVVVKTDGGGEPAGVANVVSLPVSPTSALRDNGSFSSSGLTGGGLQCFRPNDLRSRAGIGQQEQVYLLCGTDTTTGDRILTLEPSPNAPLDPSANFVPAGAIFLTAGDDPRDIAFSPDGELGLVTLGGTTSIKPLTNGASTPQADVALPNVVGPDGIAHVPNPGSLRIVSGTPSSATAGNPFFGSYRVLGGVRPFRWSEPTGTFFDLVTGAGLGNCTGLTLDLPTGVLIGTPTMTNTTCGPFDIMVTDSTPGAPQSTTLSGFTISIIP